MKRRILAAVVALVTMVGMVLFATGAPASAAWSDCPSNNFCIFGSANGNGNHYNWNTASYGHCTNIGHPWNDVASSIKNRYTSNWKVTVFVNANCNGPISCITIWRCWIGPGESMNLNGGANDAASSFDVRTI